VANPGQAWSLPYALAIVGLRRVTLRDFASACLHFGRALILSIVPTVTQTLWRLLKSE
jgi:hypothetical protein